MSTALSSVARRTSPWLRRPAAALAVVSAALHAVSLVGYAAYSPTISVMTVAMILGCLYCARHLWVRGSPWDWCLVAMMNVGMIALHLALMSPGSGGGHHGNVMQGAASASVSHPMSGPMAAALATAALESVIAATMLFYETRHVATESRRPRLPGRINA
ncbi:hypothetical protein [Rhodococcus chondri]|uniref:Uncharacterized protein n=1 Tax=Rhodococcus chondri TaxID=3065941 RepID=A0ABU7JUL1_9NOCA|nr:hypothetical protein [Rhodococcus sp. CC-R104]MEE2033711.1 hypothetical protein [Rhodococcus sp. CC-R104]